MSTGFIFTGTVSIPAAQFGALITDLINAQDSYTITTHGKVSPQLEVFLDDLSDTTTPPVDEVVVVVASHEPLENDLVKEALAQGIRVLDLLNWLTEVYPDDTIYNCT